MDWNIFASELQSVLTRYGMRLGQLDDRVGIHPEKVRRLTQSLSSPPTLPTLNPEELRQLSEEISLHKNDLLQLRAAVLATSIQLVMRDRTDFTSARRAAEQILPIVRDALITHADTQGLDDIRGGDIEAQSYIDPMSDQALEAIYNYYEQGELALSNSYDSFSYTSSLQRALEAQSAFGVALEAIDQLPAPQRGSERCQYLQQVIKKRLHKTVERLELLQRQTS